MQALGLRSLPPALTQHAQLESTMSHIDELYETQFGLAARASSRETPALDPAVLASWAYAAADPQEDSAGHHFPPELAPQTHVASIVPSSTQVHPPDVTDGTLRVLRRDVSY